MQSLAPDNADVAKLAQAQFSSNVEEIFRDNYYAKKKDGDDRWWSIDDIDNAESPHRPIAIGYRGQLAFFSEFADVADLIATDVGYAELERRILTSVGAPEENDDSSDK